MNLKAYDEITPKVDKTKTWVIVKNHNLLSREIKYRKYFTIGKRFNKENNEYEYFIILLDNRPEDRTYGTVKFDNYGRIKININSIWDELIPRVYSTDINISIKYIEGDDTSDVYKLDL